MNAEEGIPRYFTTGPTALHPVVAAEVAAAVADGFLSESHRSRRFRVEVARAVEALHALLDVPSEYRILFTASASEAMERIVEGAVSHRTLHLVNGAFARRFRTVAANLGKDTGPPDDPDVDEVVPGGLVVPDGHGFDGSLEFPLDPGSTSGRPPELLALTQNETSTGVRIPPAVVHSLADRARAAGLLVAVDLVSGWPVEEVDPSRIDAGFFSVQKGFGLPAGLGVIVASPALIERSRARQAAGEGVGGYLHLPAMAAAADRDQTVATPNMLAIRLLGRVAEAYLDRGLDTIRAETDHKARMVADALERLGELRPFVKDPAIRSRTIQVIEGSGADGTDRNRSALLEHGYAVSDGYGPWKGRHLRIANFPVQSPEAMAGLLRVLR